MGRLLLAVACACIVAPAAAAGSTLEVPAEYPTIADALSAASSGDTVLVAYGTYYESDLEMVSGVALMSETGDPDGATIDAEYSGRILSCRNLADPVLIKGFTFTHGLAGYENGGAIYCEESDLTVESVEFRGNSTYGDGGAVYFTRSSASLSDVTFLLNGAYVEGEGGAIYCHETSPLISDARFAGNSASSGGAMALASWSSPSVAVAVFAENEATEDGGALSCLLTSSGTFESVLFVDNHAANEGGAAFCVGEPEFDGVQFIRNSATNGGAISCRANSQTHVVDATLYANAAALHGGGIYCYQGDPWLARTIVAFSSDGEGLYGDATAEPVVVCCDIFGNADGEYGGDIPDFTGVGGTFSADPMFCDAAADDLVLDAASPCAPDNNGCQELIGCCSVACGEPTPVESTTWGLIKAMYR